MKFNMPANNLMDSKDFGERHNQLNGKSIILPQNKIFFFQISKNLPSHLKKKKTCLPQFKINLPGNTDSLKHGKKENHPISVARYTLPKSYYYNCNPEITHKTSFHLEWPQMKLIMLEITTTIKVQQEKAQVLYVYEILQPKSL